MTTSLGLRGQTAASLQAFKQRNENARRRVQALSEQPTTVDFAHYRSVLKNQAVVAEVERRFKEFKPATYDVARQLKAIDAFEVEAVRGAEAAREKVDLELKDLQATLKNIETARPFDELTVVRLYPYPTPPRPGPPGPGPARAGNCAKREKESADPGFCCRTKLPPPSRASTRRPTSWSPRAAGTSRDTRYGFYF